MKARLAAAALIAAFVSSPASALEKGWKDYKNLRFGMEVTYPAKRFKPGRPPDNGGGMDFTAKDGGEFLISGSFNTRELTPKNYEQEIMPEENITFRASGDDWIVLSGMREDTVWYQKTIFSCAGQLLNELSFSYPAAKKRAYDPIVEKMVRRSGRASARTVPPTVTPSSNSRRVSYSSLPMTSSAAVSSPMSGFAAQ